jgi:RNA polymerase sigma factor (sigma-70 family)
VAFSSKDNRQGVPQFDNETANLANRFAHQNTPLAPSELETYCNQLSEEFWKNLFVHCSQNLWNPLLRFGISLSGHKSDAEDLLQSTLLKAITHFPKFTKIFFNETKLSSFLGAPQNTNLGEMRSESQKKFEHFVLNSSEFLAYVKNWLYKILKNNFLDNVSKQKRLILVDSFGNGEFPEPSSHSELFSNTSVRANDEVFSSEEDNLEASEKEFYRLALDDDWKKKFEELNSKQRSIIFLVAEGHSYKEVSSILNVPIGTVMSALSRALAKIKKNEEKAPTSEFPASPSFVEKVGIK